MGEDAGPAGATALTAGHDPARPTVPQRRAGALRAVAVATVGVVVLVAGELYVSAGGALQGAGLVASYLSGITMLVLPCTLPMVLVIVPLVMGGELRRGVAMVAAFGLGVSTTLAVYGAVVAEVGSSLGLNTATRAMWFTGGAAAWLFGCSQLGLFRVRIPGVGIRTGRISRLRPGPLQALALGVLLGNAGLGCPCPAWYLLLTGVASSGSPAYGAAVGFAQGLGRVTPVLALAVAALLGVDATAGLLRRRAAVERGSGAVLVVLGSAIVAFMAIAHSWWEATVVHAGWNHFLSWLGGPQLSEVDAGGGPLPAGLWFAPWLFGALVLLPLGAAAARRISGRSARIRGDASSAGVPASRHGLPSASAVDVAQEETAPVGA